MNAEMDRTSEYGCLRVDCGRRVMRLLQNCNMRPLRCAVDCFLSAMSRRAPSPSPLQSHHLSLCVPACYCSSLSLRASWYGRRVRINFCHGRVCGGAHELPNCSGRADRKKVRPHAPGELIEKNCVRYKPLLFAPQCVSTLRPQQ